MALRARGRSRVMTARPFWWTLPLTNSSAPAMATKLRPETGSWEELIWKKLSEGRVREREIVEELIRNCEALNPSKVCMFLLLFLPFGGWWADERDQYRGELRRSSLDDRQNDDVFFLRLEIRLVVWSRWTIGNLEANKIKSENFGVFFFFLSLFFSWIKSNEIKLSLTWWYFFQR